MAPDISDISLLKKLVLVEKFGQMMPPHDTQILSSVRASCDPATSYYMTSLFEVIDTHTPAITHQKLILTTLQICLRNLNASVYTTIV